MFGVLKPKLGGLSYVWCATSVTEESWCECVKEMVREGGERETEKMAIKQKRSVWCEINRPNTFSVIRGNNNKYEENKRIKPMHLMWIDLVLGGDCEWLPMQCFILYCPMISYRASMGEWKSVTELACMTFIHWIVR